MKCGVKDLSVILIMIYTFFFQTFFTASMVKYSIFFIALALMVWATGKIKIDLYSVLWFVLIGFMVITSRSAGDLPIFLAFTVVLGIISTSGSNSWGKQFLKMITICAQIHAVITILCWIFPYLHNTFIVPTFFSSLAGRVELTYKAGFTNHYSTNGMYLGLGFVSTAIYAMVSPQHEKRNTAVWAIVILFALILTTKRTHLAAALLSILIVLMIYSKQRGKLFSGVFKASFIITAGVCMFLVAAAFIPSLGEIVDRFVELGEDDTLHGRTYFYAVAYEQWNSHPIFGSGWGGFSEAFNKTPLGKAYISSGYLKIQPHNVYLQLLSDLGLVGLAIFVVIAVSTIYKGIKKASNSAFSLLSYVCIGIIIYVLICGFTGNPLNDVQLYCPFILSCMWINSRGTNSLKSGVSESNKSLQSKFSGVSV